MEQQLVPDVFKLIWDKIPQERQKEIIYTLNQHMDKMIKESKDNSTELPTNATIKLNFAYGKVEPIQYIYIEGFVSFIKLANPIPQYKGKLIDMATIMLSYVQVSDTVDSFLDRMNEIQNLKGFKTGTGQPTEIKKINENPKIQLSLEPEQNNNNNKTPLFPNLNLLEDNLNDEDDEDDENFDPLDILMNYMEELSNKGINLTINNLTIKNININKSK